MSIRIPQNLRSFQYFPILIEKCRNQAINPEFLESFCVTDKEVKKVSLDLFLHICFASEYQMFIYNLESSVPQ